MKNNTAEDYSMVIDACRNLFEKKTKDYGTAWRILRPSSLTDQIFIKAQRIRSIEEKGEQKVSDDIRDEFVGVINYCILAIIQLNLTEETPMELSLAEVMELYDKEAKQTKKLLLDKNHDYDEAWRDMRVSSFTDIILMKILRTKQIENLNGKTLVSEGIEANYRDMINYAVFALIKLNFAKG